MTKVTSNTSGRVQDVHIDACQDGQRVDNFLLGYLKGVPRSLVYRILRCGEVRVNKGRIKPTYRLQEGDVIRIPPLRLPDQTAQAPSRGIRALVTDAVLYEDEGLLILNKPAGIAVHGGSGVSHGVIEALRAVRASAPMLELVHRLDRDTSGCLMIAKRRSVLRHLHALLRDQGVEKRYQALLQGTWRAGEQRVDMPLHKNVLRSGERLVQAAAEGKAAATVFRPLRKWDIATLVEVLPLSGRTHQIRVHAAHLRQPVAGDQKYGDDAFNREMQAWGLRRLFLHASSLRFMLPNGQSLEVKAALDPVLEGVVQALDRHGMAHGG
jgi:23S rRNA pseudouridine955/2504/2580 synthase